MISQIKDIRKIIKNTVIENTEITTISIPESDEIALAQPIRRIIALQINPENKIEAWEIMRNFLPETQRYPVIVTCWLNSGENWAENLMTEDLFNRSEYKYEPEQNTNIQKLISQVDKINIQEILQEITAISAEDFNEKMLILAQQDHQKIDRSYLEWYEPINQTLALLLLPVQKSWEVLAYLHWYGASNLGTDKIMAMLKYWHQQYEAELVCHYGTMLQLRVNKKPQTLKEALKLAREQEAIAPCTTILPGISITDHAGVLLTSDNWFLHERP